MASNSIAHVISPLKFMLLLMNIMLVITILNMRDEFVFSGIRIEFNKDSSEYKDADNVFIVCLVFFLVCNVVQIILVFLGLNIFLDIMNMMLCFIHGLGVINLSYFVLNSWTSRYLWFLFGPFAVLPLGLEAVMSFYSYTHFKRD
mmetsp:Transcript_8833/g.7812  ORF Transcript_8833/g.7812 Transcript_8833/m.7812 type:complete len:145 (+) Transcript_8833:15-449(+)